MPVSKQEGKGRDESEVNPRRAEGTMEVNPQRAEGKGEGKPHESGSGCVSGHFVESQTYFPEHLET